MDKRCIYWFIFAILIRYLTSLHAHSGQATPPMYGDYEAQRHWQEITLSLPLRDWYVDSEHNNLTYWGLDYPPLTAYHSWLNGWLAGRYFNGSWVELNNSRGCETPSQKLFMRTTVMLSDIACFMVPLLLYFVAKSSHDRSLTREAHFLCAVLYPGFILIDHGHFQYNCISLGFTLCALLAIEYGYDCFGSFWFVLALNYKQMSLYHAMPFFAYLLGKCCMQKSRFSQISKLFLIGSTVSLTFGVLWAPFYMQSGVEGLKAVLTRLFPVGRGLYEDKVANFWCTFSPIFRFNLWPREIMFRLTTLTTLAALTPSSCDLFRRPSVVRLTYALVNSSFAFFLFSYQVHEKSILLVALPVLLLFRLDPAVCMWLLLTTVASMWPLLVLKDGLLIATVACTIVYYVVANWLAQTEFGLIDALPSLYAAVSPGYNVGSFWQNSGDGFLSPTQVLGSNSMGPDSGNNAPMLRPQLPPAVWRQLRLKLMKRQLLTASLTLLIILCCVCTFMPAPKRFPDLYVVALSSCCCLHFLGFAVYFNWCQLNLSSRPVTTGSKVVAASPKKKKDSYGDEDEDDERGGEDVAAEGLSATTTTRLLGDASDQSFRARRGRANTHAAVPEWTRQDSLKFLPPRKVSQT